MKLSETLYQRTKESWNRATKKPFVIEMVKGTLKDELFKNYMLQDYLYLTEYVETLKRIRGLSQSDEVTGFVSAVIDETQTELEKVHRPNLKNLGVSEDELVKSNEIPAISNYVAFQKESVDKYGLLGGLTALLQCAWLYAYVSETLIKEYPEEIASSKYKSWFEAYTCESYVGATRMWIDILDKQSESISQNDTEIMCTIFEKCASFENGLWDALYENSH